MNIYKRIKQLCDKNTVTVKQLTETLNLSYSGIKRWDTNSPTLDSLLKVADYFNLPLDYFVGRTVANPTIANDSGIVGNNNAMTNSNNFSPNDKNLSEIETELLAICRKIDTRKKTALLTFAYGLEKEQFSNNNIYKGRNMQIIQNQTNTNNNLRKIRKQNTLTLQKLADKLGTSPQVLSRYERGEHQPDQATLIKLADFFNVSIDFLLGRTVANPTIANDKNLSEIETELLAICRKIDTRKKTALLTFAYGLEKETI
ncbi:MAG: helix-turn-helix transcriptional regulator [Clostridia bacterium]